MPTTPTKLQRWLDLVAYLAQRRFPVSTEQLWAAVPGYRAGLDGDAKRKQAVRRTFERDKDSLRRLGIPIENVTFSTNYGFEQTEGYRLAAKEFHLPYLKLVTEAREAPKPSEDSGTSERGGRRETAARDREVVRPERGRHPPEPGCPFAPEEVGAALDGLGELAALPAFPLRGAARSAYRKLSFDIDPGVTHGVPVYYAEDPEVEASRGPLSLLSDALGRRRRVRFRYRGMSQNTEEIRLVEPYGLIFQHGRWYLVGHDTDRDGERMFRVGRMRETALASDGARPAEYEVPEAFDLASYSGRSAWEVGEDEDGGVVAEVAFTFPRSLWAERNGHGALIEEREDGIQLRRFAIRRREPFLRWVLSLAGDARVVAPPDLADAFRSLASEVALRYASDPATDPRAGDPAGEDERS